MSVVSRTSEIKELNVVYQSKSAEFLAVYGRRRVGKTYLLDQFFQKADIYFYLAGEQKAPITIQLQNFTTVYNATFKPLIPLSPPENWHEALKLLSAAIENIEKPKKIVIFFDALPWLASRHSKFLSALEHYWITQWCKNPSIKLITCGSAASWMIKKIIDAKGGLHNRITKRLLLKPFDLKQTKVYLESKHIKLSNQQILAIYMVTGGIPYYLNHIQRGRSVTQNINQLCFSENGLLTDEFNRLYRSLFEAADLNITIVKAIAKYRYGISRNELLKQLKLKSGGNLNDRIAELITAGFIQKFVPFGYSKKLIHYKVIDEYSLFYLDWIAPYRESSIDQQKNYWQLVSQSPQYYNWSGLAFEAVCYKHIQQIATSLDLNQIAWQASTWSYHQKGKQSAQIDLLLDRFDDTVTIIEIKFSSTAYTFNRDEANKLLSRIDIFKERTKIKKSIQTALICANAIKPSLWLDETIDNTITLDDLFNE